MGTIKDTKKRTTSFYDLFKAVYDEVNAKEEDLVPDIIMHMIKTGKIKFICRDKECGNYLQ